MFRWNLGFGRVCNGLEMAVGFKWTDSQPISRHLGSFFDDFHDFVHFGVDSGRLMLFPEGPWTLRECHEGPGTL